MYRRYQISNKNIPLSDKTISNRNNTLKSEMTTLGLTCRLLGFIKMSDFFSLFTHFVCVKTTTFSSFYASIFRIIRSLGTMYSGDIAGLMCWGLTSDEVCQCRRCARVSVSAIIACTQSGKLLFSLCK